MTRAAVLCVLASIAQCATHSPVARAPASREACAPESVPHTFFSQRPDDARGALIPIELDGRAPNELLLPVMSADRRATIALFSLRDGAWRRSELLSRETSETGTFDVNNGFSFVRAIERESCAKHAVFRFDDAQGAVDPRWTRASIIVLSFARGEARVTLECEIESTAVSGPERDVTQSTTRTVAFEGSTITLRDASTNNVYAQARWSVDHWAISPPNACSTQQ